MMVNQTIRLPKEVRRVLVVKPSSLGDIVHVFPALEILHRRFPAAQMDFLVHPAFAQLLHYSPWAVDRRILFQRRELGRVRTFLPAFFHLFRDLRRTRYDLIIDFQGLARSAFFAWLARGATVIGFGDSRESLARFFYHKRFFCEEEHAVERNAALAKWIAGGTLPTPRPEMPVYARYERDLAVKMPDLPEKLIAVIPGARWKSKQFPPELFTEVMIAFHQKHPEYSFVGIGGSAEMAAEQRILSLLPKTVHYIPGAGKTTIGTMVELIRKCDAVLTNDSGPAHVGAAMDKPVLTFFGPTLPDKTRPYGEKCRYYRRDLSCVGCMKRRCPESDFPRCHRLDAAVIADELSNAIEKEPLKC